MIDKFFWSLTMRYGSRTADTVAVLIGAVLGLIFVGLAVTFGGVEFLLGVGIGYLAMQTMYNIIYR